MSKENQSLYNVSITRDKNQVIIKYYYADYEDAINHFNDLSHKLDILEINNLGENKKNDKLTNDF